MLTHTEFIVHAHLRALIVLVSVQTSVCTLSLQLVDGLRLFYGPGLITALQAALFLVVG